MPQRHDRPDLLERRRALRNRPTKAERVLWSALKGRRLDGLKFRRQHSVGPFVLDVYCPDRRLAIEVDGGIHDGPARARYDSERHRWLEERGVRVVRVVRVTNAEVLETLDVAVERIRQAAGPPPVPLPIRGGGTS